jgi:hypothetical protein
MLKFQNNHISLKLAFNKFNMFLLVYQLDCGGTTKVLSSPF